RAAESFATRPVTFRVGGLPDSSDELMDLLQHQVGDEWISASPGIGAIRWGGETTVDRLRRLRRTLAGLEVPLTLERAPSPVRAALGALTVAEASRIVYALARLVRATGIPRRLAGWGRIRFALGMLAATAPKVGGGRWRSVKGSGGTSPNLHQPPPTSPV